MKKNRIIVIADEGEVLWESLILPEQQTEIYLAKNSGRSFPLDSIFLSFDFNCGKARTGNYMPTCRNYPKDGDNTCDCFIAGSF